MPWFQCGPLTFPTYLTKLGTCMTHVEVGADFWWTQQHHMHDMTCSCQACALVTAAKPVQGAEP